MGSGSGSVAFSTFRCGTHMTGTPQVLEGIAKELEGTPRYLPLYTAVFSEILNSQSRRTLLRLLVVLASMSTS
eukprot:1065094-Rhodomonas_salina.2